MKNKHRIGFIGTGQMGTTILKGLADMEKPEEYSFFIVNRDSAHSRKTRDEIEGCSGGKVNVSIAEDIRSLCSESDIIFLGVRPQDMEDVLKTMNHQGKIVVSMAAGISISYIKSFLGENTSVIRIMPNTPVAVKKGVVSISRSSDIDEQRFKLIKDLLSPLGKVVEIEETLIGSITGLYGSGPAYVYMFAEAMTVCGMENGLEEKQARDLAAMTILGSAQMLLNSQETISEMIDGMCLPRGTTIEGIKTLRDNNFEERLKEGIQAAINRADAMVI